MPAGVLHTLVNRHGAWGKNSLITRELSPRLSAPTCYSAYWFNTVETATWSEGLRSRDGSSADWGTLWCICRVLIIMIYVLFLVTWFIQCNKLMLIKWSAVSILGLIELLCNCKSKWACSHWDKKKAQMHKTIQSLRARDLYVVAL